MLDWRKTTIDYKGQTVTLNEFLALVYKDKSDNEIAAMLKEAGIKTTRTAICRARRRAGLTKPQGAAVVSEFSVIPSIGPQDDPDLLLKEELLKAIKNKDVSLRELSARFDRSEATITELVEQLVGEGYQIISSLEGTARLETKTPPAKKPSPPDTLADAIGHHCLWAVMSDLHAGSTAQQITSMIAFVKLCYERGVRHIFVPGDLFAGHNVYRGQLNDLFAVGADKQLIVMTMTLPRLDGLTYYTIGGNHDFSFVSSSGFDIMYRLAKEREDVVYLGFDQADIALTDRCDIRLWHPRGGTPYATSYRLQKGVEQMAFDELTKAIETGQNARLRYVFAGHLHISLWSRFGPITGMQCGCFEGTTNLLKRMARFASVGGFIMEAWLTDNGLVQRERIEWVPFLEIQNDFLNYPDVLAAIGAGVKPEKPNPVFRWDGNG